MKTPSDSRQSQPSPTANHHETKLRHRQRSVFYIAAALLSLVGVVLIAAYVLSQQGSDSPNTPIVAAPTATRIPPTEPAQEVALQQQMSDWFMTVEGVVDVLSLDVDAPDDEAPLIYAELDVKAGYNTSSVPASFMNKLNETFNTTTYSDFVVILSDGVQVIEYSFDPENAVWNETVLATMASTDES